MNQVTCQKCGQKVTWAVLPCQICGAEIPFRLEKRTVECKFCGSQYEVVKTKTNGKPSPGQLGWFLGGVIVGFILGWPVSRAALASVAKVSIEELERRVEEWGKR